MSIPVPIDDLLDPKPEPVPVAVAEAAIANKSKATPPSSRPVSPKPAQKDDEEEEDEEEEDEEEDDQEEEVEEPPTVKALQAPEGEEPEPIPSPEPKIKLEEPEVATADENSCSIPPIASDLPFKCHLCESSFADRVSCLDHIKGAHVAEFALLMNKVTLEAESEAPSGSPDDDESGEGGTRGKFPDYANRKVGRRSVGRTWLVDLEGTNLNFFAFLSLYLGNLRLLSASLLVDGGSEAAHAHPLGRAALPVRGVPAPVHAQAQHVTPPAQAQVFDGWRAAANRFRGRQRRRVGSAAGCRDALENVPAGAQLGGPDWEPARHQRSGHPEPGAARVGLRSGQTSRRGEVSWEGGWKEAANLVKNPVSFILTSNDFSQISKFENKAKKISARNRFNRFGVCLTAG